MSFFTFITSVSSFLTDTVLTSVLLSGGIYLTLKTRFVQIRCFKEGIKNTFSGLFSKKSVDGVSPFAALATCLAAQLGTGNIVGVSSAILTGGPGTVFWIWVSSFFGSATAYCEAYFAQKTKIRENDGFSGGAAYYIKSAFSGKTGKILACAFSICSVSALGFTGVAVQSNSISVALKETFNIPPFLTGIFILTAAAFIIKGGNRAVTKFSEKTVPVLAGAYFALCFAVLIINFKNIPLCFRLIFSCAFTPEAFKGTITGITVKTVISQGIKRGLFTNEAGMGSTSGIHALSFAPTPHYQGTLAIASVFTDTFVMTSLTALCVICVLFTGHVTDFDTLSGSLAVTKAFSCVLGHKGAGIFTATAILFFAFASVIGWFLSGKLSCTYLFGKKSEKIYCVASLIFVFLGAVFPSQTVWTLTDIFNTFMVLTNLPSLIKLSGKDC